MSTNTPFYREYVTDDQFLSDYQQYQQRYVDNIRESDRILIEMVREIAEGRPEGAAGLQVLDEGCSTGNLLLHLKRALPALTLTGGELDRGSLALCRSNTDLAGIEFEEMDLLDIARERAFDVIIVNAVFYMLDDDQLKQALASVARALRPGGHLLTFDFFHPYEQKLDIRETSETHPRGLMLHFRPQSEARRMLADAGFDQVTFRPFVIPIDLQKPARPGDMGSYTVATEAGRLLFRGTLFQPWCHMSAVRAR